MTDLSHDADQILQAAEREEQRAAFDLATYRRPFVTAGALAGYLGVDRRTIVRMIAMSALEGVKVGRQWRIPTAAARETFHVEQKQAS